MTESYAKAPSDFLALVDAGNLQELVSLLSRISGSDQFSPKVLQLEFVVDADAIIQTLIRKCQNPDFVSTFEELKASGVVVFHLPHWGITEIEGSALKQVADRRGIRLDRLRQEWRRLIPCFTVHDGYSFPHVQGWDASNKDWKDEPYASLQHDITAKAVLSSNTDDLIQLGADVLSPRVLKEILDYARAETACVTIKVGGVGICTVSANGIEAAIKSMPNLWVKTPNGWKWGALAIFSGVLAYPPTRRKLFSSVKKVGAVGWKLSSALLMEYAENQKVVETFKETQ